MALGGRIDIERAVNDERRQHMRLSEQQPAEQGEEVPAETLHQRISAPWFVAARHVDYRSVDKEADCSAEMRKPARATNSQTGFRLDQQPCWRQRS